MYIVISMRSFYLCLLTLFLLLTSLYVLGLILSMAILPHNLHDTESPVYGSATIPLDMLVHRWWLRSMDIAFDVDGICSGHAAVVESGNCSTLPIDWDYAESIDACRLYALPGSFFIVTLQNSTITRAMKPHIWVTHTEEAYRKFFNQLSLHGERVYRCEKNYSDATCYFAENYVGSSLRIDVKSPGYYCLITTNAEDVSVVPPVQFGIAWHFNYTSYNFEAIKSRSPVVAPWKYIDGKTETSVVVSDLFNFTRMNCALLSLHCTNTEEHKFTVRNLVRRWDVAVLLTCVYVAFLCVLVLGVVAQHVSCRVCNRRDTIQNSSRERVDTE